MEYDVTNWRGVTARSDGGLFVEYPFGYHYGLSALNFAAYLVLCCERLGYSVDDVIGNVNAIKSAKLTPLTDSDGKLR